MSHRHAGRTPSLVPAILMGFALLAAMPFAIADAPVTPPGAPPLRDEAAGLLMRMDGDLDPGCARRTIVRTEVLESPGGEPAGPSAAAADPARSRRDLPRAERWHLDRCGTLVSWDVRYASSTDGGIHIVAGLAASAQAGLTEPAPFRPGRPGVAAGNGEPPAPGQPAFLVTHTGDAGPGSLTQAILDANASPNLAGPDRILLRIPGPGPHVISLIAALPSVTDPVVIDGRSAAGSAYLVAIDGSRLSRPAHGLVLRAGSSTVRGLRIHGFDGDAIRIENGGSNLIEGNILGGRDGDAGAGPGADTTLGAEGAPTVEAALAGDAGLSATPAGAVPGAGALRAVNTGSGIAIVNSAGNLIGGETRSASNRIEGNGAAGVRVTGHVSIDNAILGNRIAGNADDGIVLDGLTLDDGMARSAGGPGTGPNRLQRAPILTSTSFSPARGGREADIMIEGRVEGDPGSTYRVELYATAAGGATRDRGGRTSSEGERFLADIDVTTGADGLAGFRFHLPSGVHSRDLLTATATDAAGSTSEFSAPLQASAILVTWNSGSGNWGTAANWSPAQVPAVGDDVVIAANGANTTFTVTLDVAATLNSLTLGGGAGTQTLSMASPTLTLNGPAVVGANGVLTMSNGTLTGTGTLTIDGTFNWSGGLMSGVGVTTVNGPLNLSGLTAISGRTLNNNGTATWTSANSLGVRTGGGSVINNNGTWDAQTDGASIVPYYSGTTTFNNAGLFRKSAGTGGTTVSIAFNNTGSVDVQSGTLALYAGSSSTGFAVSGGATLRFASGTFNLDAGTTFTGSGTVLVYSAGTVNVNAAVSIPAATTFTFQDGILGGTGTLTIDGTFNWTGGRMTGAGATTVNGPFNLAGLTEISARTLNNNSTVAWTSANTLGVRTGGGSVINNNGTWDAQTDGASIVPYFSGTTTFNNAGIFRKSAGTGGTTVSIAFNNTGSVDVQTGTLALYAGSSSTGFAVSGGATLRFASGTFNLDAGTTFSGPGTVLVYTAGTVNVNAAVSIPAATTFTFQDGILGGIGTLTIDGAFNWTGGRMTGAGVTTVNGPFNLAGLTEISARTLNNNSTVAWTSANNLGVRTGGGSVINNNGTWDAQTDGASIVPYFSGTTTFNNAGLFRKSAGTGGTTVSIAFNNTGSVDVQTGTLALYAGSNSTGFAVSGGATLRFASGTFNLNAGTTFTGSGTVLVYTTGTVNVNAAVSIPAATTVTFQDGILGGTGTLTVEGTFNWTGGLMTGAGVTTLNGPFNLGGLTELYSRVLNNNGTATWTSALNLGMRTGGGSVINNYGTWDAQTGDGAAIVVYWSGGTAFNNFGTLRKSAGAGPTAINIPLANTGLVDIQSGTLNVSSSNYTQTAGVTRLTGGALSSTTNINVQGGILAGSGTVTGPVIVSGTGALAPGQSPGTLAIAGAYTQQAPDSAFDVELGGTTPGTQFDRVNITGAATLAGALNVSLIDGFVPSPGDSFTLMIYPSRTGALSLNLPIIECLGWRVDQGPTALVLTAIARPAEVGGVAFAIDTVGLSWEANLPLVSPAYDVLRGNLDKMPVGTGTGQTCLAQGLAGTSTTDAGVPALGSGWWYLVRERVTACGVGTYGHATSGAERISATCP